MRVRKCSRDLVAQVQSLLEVCESRKQAEAGIRRLNASLMRRAEELEAANRELEAFSYSVSHDLRGPLRAVDCFSTVLLEQYRERLDAEGQRLLMLVHDAARQMDRLIEDLLRLARLPLSSLDRRKVDVSAIAHEVVEELRRREPPRPACFEIAASLSASADDGLLRAVFDNLLGNAWKFSARQPEIRIEVGSTERAGQTVFFVRDNGAGFDMRHAGKLFLPFRRLHRDEEFSGTGIGLATVQRIIRRHGGKIWAESAVGRGATFYFTLPEPGDGNGRGPPDGGHGALRPAEA